MSAVETCFKKTFLCGSIDIDFDISHREGRYEKSITVDHVADFLIQYMKRSAYFVYALSVPLAPQTATELHVNTLDIPPQDFQQSPAIATSVVEAETCSFGRAAGHLATVEKCYFRVVLENSTFIVSSCTMERR